MRTTTKSAAIFVLLMTLLSCGFCQDDRPVYVVAKLFSLDKQEDSDWFAQRLAGLIEQARLRSGTEPSKDPFSCCPVKHDKPAPPCVAVFARIEVGSDNSKIIRVYVVEGKEQGEVAKDLSCDSSFSNKDCYDTLLPRIARAVKKHDDTCHTGKKCVCENFQFIAK
jgi:hypothetical protein